MKAYRIGLVILLAVVICCGAWYFYGVYQDNATPKDATLVQECKPIGGEHSA